MVERNLAKVEVESSRLFSRSRFFLESGQQQFSVSRKSYLYKTARHCTEAIELSPLPKPSYKHATQYKKPQKSSFLQCALKTSLFVALGLLSSKAVQAEWVEIASNATVNKTLYIDPSSKKKNKKFVTIWAMYDDAKPQLINNKPSLSSIHEYQVDCSISWQQSMRRTFYEGPKGTGIEVGSSIDTNWVPINPATVAEAIYKVTLSQALIQAACSKD